MRDILIFFALVLTLPMIFRRLFVGVVLWGWVSFIFPEDYLYGFMTAVPMAKLVSGLTILCMLISREKKNFYIDKVTIVALLFAIVGISSSIFSDMTFVDPWAICQRVIKILTFCFVLQVLVRNQLRAHAVLAAVCLGLGFHGSLEGMKFLGSLGGHKVDGMASFGDNNDFALAIDMVIPILLYLAKHTTSKVIRIGFVVVAGLCAFAVIGTFSRGGFVGLMIVAMSWILTERNKVRNLIYVGLMGAALLSVAPATWFNRVDTIETANQDGSFMGRVMAWKMSTIIALDNPILGIGFHGIQDVSVWERYRPHFGTMSFIASGEPTEQPRAAHSIYFEVLGDLGFTGLILFLSMLVLSMVNASRIRRLAKVHEDIEWAGNLANALRTSMLAYMVSGAALSMAYFEFFFVLVAMLSLLRRMVEHDLVPASVRATVPRFAARRSQPLVGAPARSRAV